jgi:nucleotide-binding universal stress UspA family protein
MKVLVGVDGSSNSFAAVTFVGRFLSPERDEIVLLFASPTLHGEADFDPSIEERARTVLSRTVLDAAIDRLPDAWRRRVKTEETAGLPSRAILAAVKEQSADLVVVGFRGTTSLWEQFLLGSVSRAVVHSATVPVLVVKTPPNDAAATAASTGPAANNLKLLAAYDGSPAAERIAASLGKFSWPEGTEGWLIHVVRPMFPYDVPDWVKNQPRDPDVAAMADAWKQEHQQQLQTAEAELKAFREKLPGCFAKHDVIVVEGRPAEQIVAQLRAKGIDLAIVGSRGRGHVERLLLGSTTEEVLAAAPCSVLVVR